MVSFLAWIPLRRRLRHGDWLRRLGRAVRGRAGLFLCLMAAGSLSAEPKLEVDFERNPIGLGESTTMNVTFQDCSPSGAPNLPAIANLEMGSPTVRETVVSDGLTVTRKTIFSMEVRPTKEGQYTIPALQAQVGGVVLQSRPVTLKVQKQLAGDGVAFVRIVPETNVIYLGQILPVDVQCYCQDNVGNIQMPQFSSDSFIVGDLPNSHQQPPKVRVGDAIYNEFSFRTTVRAVKPGTYPLGPATWGLVVFGGQRTFFGRWTESHQGSFTSDAPEIRVLPVPTAGAPASFNGAVGDFKLAQYEAGPTTVAVGDPITLKIRIAGRGAFDTVALPTNSEGDWHDFKSYPPTSKFETSDPMQIEGAKYFEEVISPQSVETKEIPPFAFSFFDPAKNTFRMFTHAAIPLTVRATVATPSPSVLSGGGATPGAQEQNEDIVHIKPKLENAQASGPPLMLRPGFLAWQALAPLAWVCALVRRKQKERLANNPRLRRQRKVWALVRAGLADLSRHAAANDADKFYATVLRLLQEQLGERLDLPAPAITEAVLEDLPQKGLSPETQGLLHELFQACNQYRYTPEHTSREMASLIPKVKTVLQALQGMPASQPKSSFPQGVLVLLLLLSATTLRAASTPADAFNEANKLYEGGKYAQAAADYEELSRRVVSPGVLFNLGNAWFKAGKMGRAICAYRQAEILAPRDPDIRANLQFVRAQAGDNNPALPGSRWTRWAGRLTLNEWTVGTSAVLALFFLYLTARELWPAWKKSGATAVAMLGLAAVGLGACLGVAAEQRLVEKTSVVIVPEAVARLGPYPESQSVLTVHDGTELFVLGSDGDWLQVSDAAHHVGWMAQNEVAVIR